MRNAKQILNASIKDIEAGKWCKGDLITSRDDPDFGLLDCVIADVKERDQMGCAIGLVSLHGENFGKPKKVTLNGKKVSILPVQYVSDARPIPKNLAKSVDALYRALPTKFRSKKAFVANYNDALSLEDNETLADVTAKQQAVIGFNDRPTTTQKRALQWFKKAVTLL